MQSCYCVQPAIHWNFWLLLPAYLFGFCTSFALHTTRDVSCSLFLTLNVFGCPPCSRRVLHIPFSISFVFSLPFWLILFCITALRIRSAIIHRSHTFFIILCNGIFCVFQFFFFFLPFFNKFLSCPRIPFVFRFYCSIFAVCLSIWLYRFLEQNIELSILLQMCPLLCRLTIVSHYDKTLKRSFVYFFSIWLLLFLGTCLIYSLRFILFCFFFLSIFCFALLSLCIMCDALVSVGICHAMALSRYFLDSKSISSTVEIQKKMKRRKNINKTIDFQQADIRKLLPYYSFSRAFGLSSSQQQPAASSSQQLSSS